MTQAEQILKHLTRRPITSLQAIHKYGCTRLSGRIYDLKKAGHHITREMVKVRDRNDRETTVARYHLVD